MSDTDAYKVSVREFIKRGKFPDVIISRAEALHYGFKVYRTGKRCLVCGLKTWKATKNWACLNCRVLKLGRWRQ